LLIVAAVLVAGSVAFALTREDDFWPPAERGDLLPPVRKGITTVWAVGDGADGGRRAGRVAQQITAGDEHRFRLLYLGDVYETGSALDYRENYETVYGRFEERTAPTLGNHESENRLEGYIPYWAGVHGRAPSYFNLRASGWQLLGLNSEIDASSESAQVAWLESQLAREKFGTCRIAFWHRPRYSAGPHGDQADMAALWEALKGQATAVINGHEHNMQRLEPRAGLTGFIAGAGGHELQPPDESDPRLAFSGGDHPGALRIELSHERLRWWFVTAAGRTLDRGRLSCRRG